MTKPDSTDAGGVTHGEARSAAHSLFHTDPANHDRLRRYIDQQESALATLTGKLADMTSRAETAESKAERLETELVALTRERDGLRAAIERLRGKPYGANMCVEFWNDPFVAAVSKPTTPPAPLPDNLPGHVDSQIEWLESVAAEKRAPLPGGQGQVEALRREIVEALRAVAFDSDKRVRWEGLRLLADRLEQGGEGREG